MTDPLGTPSTPPVTAVPVAAGGATVSSASASSEVAKGLGRVVVVGGGMTTVVSVFNDVLVPQGELVLGFLVLAVLMLALTLLPKRWFGGVHDVGKKVVHDYWGRPLQTALAVAIGLSGLAYGVSRTAPPGGLIGSKVAAVHDWQLSNGILTDIRTALGNVKQETSSDPRKELANLGVSWSAQGLVDALKIGDERTARLFLEGGMAPAAITNNGASAALYLLQPGLPLDPTPMLQLLSNEGFDFNSTLVDDYIMSGADPASIFPPQFESVDPPAHIGGKHFDGPALLWVVVEASWYGPTAHDITTISYLVHHGVDRRAALKYFTDTATWNDTPAAQQVLALLNS